MMFHGQKKYAFRFVKDLQYFIILPKKGVFSIHMMNMIPLSTKVICNQLLNHQVWKKKMLPIFSGIFI